MADQSPLANRLNRRRWLLAAVATAGAMVAACAPAAAPDKPTEAPKAAAPAAPAAPAAAPAASPAVAAPAVPAAAAASPAAAPSNGLAKPKELTQVSQVMNWFAQAAHGGLFAALKSGDYEKQNLKMTNEQGGPQISAAPLVATGKHTFGMMQADQLLLARDEGLPLVGVFAIFQINPQGLMYHQENPVKDFPDLNGRKVYVSPTASYWQYFVKKYKLDKVEQLAYNGQLPIFLNDKTAVFQCYISSEPPAAKKAGANPGYLLNADSGFNPYGNIMVANEQTIKEKPEVVQAYVTATLAGWKAFLDNPEPTVGFITSDYRKDYDVPLGLEAARIEKPLVLGKANDPKAIGSISDQRFKELHDELREVGVLKKDLDYKAAFNATFIEAAQRA
jgi:NitT/TauT family transport system substrate-binding protein